MSYFQYLYQNVPAIFHLISSSYLDSTYTLDSLIFRHVFFLTFILSAESERKQWIIESMWRYIPALFSFLAEVNETKQVNIDSIQNNIRIVESSKTTKEAGRTEIKSVLEYLVLILENLALRIRCMILASRQ